MEATLGEEGQKQQQQLQRQQVNGTDPILDSPSRGPHYGKDAVPLTTLTSKIRKRRGEDRGRVEESNVVRRGDGEEPRCTPGKNDPICALFLAAKP